MFWMLPDEKAGLEHPGVDGVAQDELEVGGVAGALRRKDHRTSSPVLESQTASLGRTPPGETMRTKSKATDERKIERPERAKLSEEESLKRMRDFGERKERFVAAVREGES